MTISELKSELQKLEDRGVGGYDVRLVVQDDYSRYGEETVFEPKVENNISSGLFINNNANWVTLTCHLKNKEGKAPKITYRSL